MFVDITTGKGTGSQYRHIAEQIKQAIHAGLLAPDTRLPSVRTLAIQYNISLTTALKALRTLEDEHYAVARPKSGFFVASCNNLFRKESVESVPTREIAPLDEQTELHMAMVGEDCRVRLDLANGDSSLYPIKKLSLIMRQLGYSKPLLLGDTVKGTGYAPLKSEIIRRAISYGCNINPDNILITNGCIEALSLALRATVMPGDVVAVESPCYFVLLQMLRSLRLRVIEVDTCQDGYVDKDKLIALFRKHVVKVFVTLSNINNPSGKSIPNEQKAYIARQADENNVIIIEDDIFGDTTFGEQRPFPMRAFSPNVILCSGFSKTVAPGIRIGWVHSNYYMRKIISLKYTSSMGSPILSQATIAELLKNGGYDAHLRKLRNELSCQIHKIRHAVLRTFPVGTKVSEPEGGYVLWVEMPKESLNVRTLFIKARQAGIGIAPGHIFATDDRYDHCFRLNAGFGFNKEVEQAIEQLAQWCIQSLKE
ncbi:PLP-dependent aminotransferase family protein [Salmonella enterica]|uniref:PLP-dependent aminotransferase family protein n=1 Tax=Salmonella enterica TaxID=28901 RepID=A0A5T8B996_SALER|nr:PLP-dependent aminotransferase family protein [Salmonella enterica]EBN4400441.1 PLP-dependent aminotransferase family protein [Salmonella enterica]EGC1083194.1 PLP-dependent aminotransferase family protein [Salmonella enterica]EGK1570513.1 PLP-dependent aminotransferase family protein [Salmonella enterica]